MASSVPARSLDFNRPRGSILSEYLATELGGWRVREHVGYNQVTPAKGTPDQAAPSQPARWLQRHGRHQPNRAHVRRMTQSTHRLMKKNEFSMHCVLGWLVKGQ